MKQKRYWLRGWVIITSVPLLYQIFMLPFSESYNLNISKILLYILPYFIIGMFFGWIYGKIKNRNKSI